MKEKLITVVNFARVKVIKYVLTVYMSEYPIFS